MNKFSHIDKKKIKMVYISKKKKTERIAQAECFVKFKESIYNKIFKEGSKKGEIFNTARLAGIMAAKKTSELIPLCHNINILSVEIEFKNNDKDYSISVFTTAKANHSTGVEMEAITACSISAITIYDMLKSLDKSIVINNLRLKLKSGGKSGIYKND